MRRTLFVNGVNFRRAWVITGSPPKLIPLQGSPLRNDRDQTGRHAHSILILKLDLWVTGSFLFEITFPLYLSRVYFRDVITMWQIAIPIFHPTLSTTRQPYIVRFKQRYSLCVLWKLSDKRCVWLLAPASFFFRLLKCVLDVTIWGIPLTSKSHHQKNLDCFFHTRLVLCGICFTHSPF